VYPRSNTLTEDFTLRENTAGYSTNTKTKETCGKSQKERNIKLLRYLSDDDAMISIRFLIILLDNTSVGSPSSWQVGNFMMAYL